MLIEIKLDNAAALDAALRRLVERTSDLTPAMREISELLYDQTMENFEREGRPSWLPLAPATVKQRGNAHPILQRTAGLKSSVHPFFDAVSAGVGVAKPYARIQQQGGKAGRGHKVTIPARPYLPATEDGRLQPEAQAAIMQALNTYLAAE